MKEQICARYYCVNLESLIQIADKEAKKWSYKFLYIHHDFLVSSQIVTSDGEPEKKDVKILLFIHLTLLRKHKF